MIARFRTVQAECRRKFAGVRNTRKLMTCGLVRRHLCAVGDSRTKPNGAAVAEQADLDLLVDRRQADEVDQVVVVLDARAVEFAG